jgi:hypothetical protein
MRFYQDIREVEVTPITAVGAYAAGRVVGGLLTFANAFPETSRCGSILSATVFDDAGQTAAYDLILFRSQPAGTFTDNVAFAPSKADSLLITPVVSIATGARVALGSRSISSLGNQELFIRSNVNSLFGVLVDRTGRTGASTSDITVRLSIKVC